MDKDAVDTIIGTVLATQPVPSSLIEKAIKIPAGMDIRSLEPFHDNRFRFRGVFTTTHASEFVEYINGYGDEQDVFINPETLGAVCYLDIGTLEEPGHCQHMAVVELKPTAGYEAVIALAKSGSLDQLEAIELLEDWNELIECSGQDNEKIANGAAIAAFRGIRQTADAQADSEINPHSRRTSALEQIDVVARNGNLPTHIKFTLKPYEDLKERSFVFSVYVRTGETPRFKFRLIAEESTKEAIANEFKELVIKDTEENYSVLIGKFKP